MLRLHKYKSNPVPFHFSFFFKTPLNTKNRHKATSARRKSKRRARLNQRQQDIKKNAGKECSQLSKKADEKGTDWTYVKVKGEEGKREEERDIIETSNIQILLCLLVLVSLRHVFPFPTFFSSLPFSRNPRGVEAVEENFGGICGRAGGTAPPQRFTAKLPFRDWQPVNDSMLEQSTDHCYHYTYAHHQDVCGRLVHDTEPHKPTYGFLSSAWTAIAHDPRPGMTFLVDFWGRGGEEGRGRPRHGWKRGKSAKTTLPPTLLQQSVVTSRLHLDHVSTAFPRVVRNVGEGGREGERGWRDAVCTAVNGRFQFDSLGRVGRIGIVSRYCKGLQVLQKFLSEGMSFSIDYY